MLVALAVVMAAVAMLVVTVRMVFAVIMVVMMLVLMVVFVFMLIMVVLMFVVMMLMLVFVMVMVLVSVQFLVLHGAHSFPMISSIRSRGMASLAQVATILVSLNSRTISMTSARVASSTRSALFTRIRSASLSWYSNR